MNKWSRLNTTIKLAFGVSDAGNLLEPLVDVFSPVANLTSQAVDSVGDYLPKAYVDEANAAVKSLSEDESAGKINRAIDAVSDSDFYKNYATATTDPGLTSKLDRYGLNLSKRQDASPLRKALNSIRTERHFSRDNDDIWRGVVGNSNLDKDHVNAIRRNTALSSNTGDAYDIASHAKKDLFNIPFKGYKADTNYIDPKGSSQEYSQSVLAPYQDKGRIPLTDTIDDFTGINNPEFSSMSTVSGDSMSNADFRDYANRLKKTYGEQTALDVINSQIKGNGVPSLLDIELPKKR